MKKRSQFPSNRRGSRRRRSKAEVIRRKVAEKLPSMLSAALEAYDRILSTPMPEEPKAQGAQLAAAKTALSHLENLLNLADGLPDDDGDDDGNDTALDGLISAAREAVGSLDTERG